tara:strand:+ start:140 stop:742 length:603 start_codon:yes stop_codon:yes gene_type:complete
MSKSKKSILFTAIQSANGVAAIKAGEAAEVSKLKFFKSIKRKVTADNIDAAKPAFEAIAYAYFDVKHKLKGRLIKAIVEGKLKETTKLGALTIRQHKDAIRKMAFRWRKHYSQWLKTGVVATHGGKRKRATKGGVTPKGKDKVILNQAPETTPLKKTIETISGVNNLILKEVKWSACREGLRQEIEIAAIEFVVLLNEIK